MTAETRRAADQLAADLRAIVAARLRSLVVYGGHAADAHGRTDAAPGDPVHTLVIVHDLGLPDLEGCAARAAHWGRARLATPLLLGEAEFARSLDAFPIELGAVLARHEVIVGSDPFTGLAVAPADLRRACEVQVRAHLLHLREGFIEGRGTPASVAVLVAESAAPLRTLLVNLARLAGAANGTAAEITAHAETMLGPSARVLGDVMDAGRETAPAADAARLFPAYLAAVEHLVTFVDQRPAP